MSNISLRTHIIPIGNASTDRIIAPLKKLRADRVYLLTVSFKDAFYKTVEDVKAALFNDLKIEQSDIIILKVDYYNLVEFLGEIARICSIEQELKSEIFMNISGGTMISVVGTLASVYFGVKPYFAQYDYSNQILLPDLLFPPIPYYKVVLPTKNEIFLLTALMEYANLTQNFELGKGKCIEIIQLIDPETDLKSKSPNDYNKLNSRYLQGFLNQNYIEEDKNTRGLIRLTNHGIFTAKIFAIYYQIDLSNIIQNIKSK